MNMTHKHTYYSLTFNAYNYLIISMYVRRMISYTIYLYIFIDITYTYSYIPLYRTYLFVYICAYIYLLYTKNIYIRLYINGI